MDAPNAPNPAIPNIQGNPDQNQDQDQNQVPAGQVPAQVPIQPVPQLVQHLWLLLVLYLFPKSYIKIG